MKRDAVADVFARIGKAKVDSGEEARQPKPAKEAGKRKRKEESPAPVTAGDPAVEATLPDEGKAGEAFKCQECGVSMRPVICMMDEVFETVEKEDASAKHAGRAGRKRIGSLYCCPMCGALKVKVFKEDDENNEDNKEEKA